MHGYSLMACCLMRLGEVQQVPLWVVERPVAVEGPAWVLPCLGRTRPPDPPVKVRYGCLEVGDLEGKRVDARWVLLRDGGPPGDAAPGRGAEYVDRDVPGLDRRPVLVLLVRQEERQAHDIVVKAHHGIEVVAENVQVVDASKHSHCFSPCCEGNDLPVQARTGAGWC